MKNFKTKLVSVFSTAVMCASCISTISASATNETIDIDSTSVDSMLDVLDTSVELDTNADIIVFDEEKIDDLCSNFDLDALNASYAKIGVEAITAEEFSQLMIDGINSVNDELQEGNFEILDGGTIVDTDDDTYYLQGGSTYDETHWWGRRRYMSTSAANTWAYDMNKAAAVNAGAAIIAGAAFGGVGAIPNGLTSAYAWYLANDITYYNSLSNRGIVTDITWVLVYSMDTQ